jgi:hypothetical protein
MAAFKAAWSTNSPRAKLMMLQLAKNQRTKEPKNQKEGRGVSGGHRTSTRRWLDDGNYTLLRGSDRSERQISNMYRSDGIRIVNIITSSGNFDAMYNAMYNANYRMHLHQHNL